MRTPQRDKVSARRKQRMWDLRFLEMATMVAGWSRDNSMGVGCIIVAPDKTVRSMGYNGLPRGIEYTKERMERPEKYIWTEHAERNAIYNTDQDLKGCTAYIACVPHERGGIAPCADCSRGLIQKGIVEIVGYNNTPNEEDEDRPWVKGQLKAVGMLREAGVKLRLINA